MDDITHRHSSIGQVLADTGPIAADGNEGRCGRALIPALRHGPGNNASGYPLLTKLPSPPVSIHGAAPSADLTTSEDESIRGDRSHGTARPWCNRQREDRDLLIASDPYPSPGGLGDSIDRIRSDVKRATELAMDLRRDSDTRVLCAVSMMLNVIAPERHG